MNADDLCTLPVRALAAVLRHGEVSSEEVTRAFLDRIEAVNPKLNVVLHLRADAALTEARAADQVPADRRGVLHGVPMTIKDSLDTAGIITTGGTKGRAEFVPSQDATVVQRLREAGAIIMGKANTPELTLNYETSNLVYGRMNNPFDLNRTSGGSSGGAAAITAAGGSPLDIGSDTGASIRLPAHFCGITGLKATAGRVPRTGHIIDYQGMPQFLTHIGPLARRVDDLALLLSVIAGPDGVDPHIMPVPLGDPSLVQVVGLRVGHFTRLPPLGPTPDTAAAVQSAAAALLDAGCPVREIEIPESQAIFEMYMGVLFGDGGAAVKRALDRWGTSESPLRTRVEGMKALSSSELTALHEQLDRWRSRMLALFAEADVIICPVNVGPAPVHSAFERPSATYTQIFNLTGWPSTVVRAGTRGRGGNGTPIEDDGGGSKVMITWPAMSAPENIAEGRIPLPARRQGTGLRPKGDGGPMPLDLNRESYVSTTYTPLSKVERSARFTGKKPFWVRPMRADWHGGVRTKQLPNRTLWSRSGVSRRSAPLPRSICNSRRRKTDRPLW